MFYKSKIVELTIDNEKQLIVVIPKQWANAVNAKVGDYVSMMDNTHVDHQKYPEIEPQHKVGDN